MSERFIQVRNNLKQMLYDVEKPWTPVFEILENKTCIDRLYLATGILVLASLYLVFGCAAQLVCNMIGLIYPAYVSIKALETSTKEDDTKWLTYWVVYGIFSVVEFFSDLLISWFPLYWLGKCAFLIWLMIPAPFNGSTLLYNQIIRPYFVRHQSKIDRVLNKISDKVIDPVRELASDSFKSD